MLLTSSIICESISVRSRPLFASLKNYSFCSRPSLIASLKSFHSLNGRLTSVHSVTQVIKRIRISLAQVFICFDQHLLYSFRSRPLFASFITWNRSTEELYLFRSNASLAPWKTSSLQSKLTHVRFN